ncbi:MULTISPECIES: MurR/RpiR family transcriptional regulator [Paenibacillus]|jgi:DNA-binding MurR/RpiR family transcriptional regulator|uniref:MurR/RpiR family transcriptional regulator n=1 Tax=Paenibacillus baimaensis TaxID=2982185 RepID=A0ABT2UUC9_9BACL|nr:MULTISPECIES: MurR/RpiR family transcriptional regulator [unclassified Paenibacillus]MCU6798283.1 MurR/RpiR family transcriptional regulator [Paenibacillus sp. WQ 127069]OMF03925.1 RpiR family transcriptional regulator [Paenibacillus sp. FSL H7-0331]
MVNQGLISIRESLDTLKPTERKVALYILEHPEMVMNASVQKLAELAEVSEATIVRLARSLHMKGFQELKLRIAADLAKSSNSMGTSYQEIQIDGSIPSLIQSISHNNILSIQDTLAVLSVEDVEKAIESLDRAKRVYIFGVGASAVIAQDFKQKLSRINRWCEMASDFDSQVTLAANMNEHDVAFGISYSGQTESIIQSLEIAKESGATIIAMTKFGHNPVSELADICLFTSSMEQSIRSGAMASRIVQLNVIDILYVGIASRSYEAVIQALENTRKAVRGSKRNA